MKFWKNSERLVKGGVFRKSIKDMGGQVKEIGEYSKWVDVAHGRIQNKITVYELNGTFQTMYLLCDNLDRAVCEMQTDKEEVMGYLKEHGWKTTKDWYIEDCGMSEETWNVWNGTEEC